MSGRKKSRSNPVGKRRLDAEIEELVQFVEDRQAELAHSVEALRKTIEVNRRDLLGIAMRSWEIHSNAIKLLIAAYRAERLRNLYYPPNERVAEILKKVKSGPLPCI